jgi:DNA-directed RNA polymerase specialized sigma24 family protein
MMNHRIFERTALPHMTNLHTYAFHLAMDSDNAKDLLQETYLKAFRFWGNFEKGTNIKAWLYCIMKNSYINLYKKEIKEPKRWNIKNITCLRARHKRHLSTKNIFRKRLTMKYSATRLLDPSNR